MFIGCIDSKGFFCGKNIVHLSQNLFPDGEGWINITKTSIKNNQLVGPYVFRQFLSNGPNKWKTSIECLKYNGNRLYEQYRDEFEDHQKFEAITLDESKLQAICTYT